MALTGTILPQSLKFGFWWTELEFTQGNKGGLMTQDPPRSQAPPSFKNPWEHFKSKQVWIPTASHAQQDSHQQEGAERQAVPSPLTFTCVSTDLGAEPLHEPLKLGNTSEDWATETAKQVPANLLSKIRTKPWQEPGTVQCVRFGSTDKLQWRKWASRTPI